MTHSPGADAAINRAIDGALNALEACTKRRSSIKRFVYTSSSFAATQPKPNVRFSIAVDSYNDEAVQRAHQPNPDGETVYAASKVLTERALVNYVEALGDRCPLVMNMSNLPSPPFIYPHHHSRPYLTTLTM